MKKILIAAVAALALVGCADAVKGTNVGDGSGLTGNVDYIEVDGMTCIAWSTGYKGGLTCDWAQWEGRD